MNKKLMRMLAASIAICLTICSMFSPLKIKYSAAAKKKVKLERKLVTVYVGKTVKIKLKNNKKKTKWTVTLGKKNISLSKKKKTSVTVKGKIAGKAKVQAKIGKRKYITTVTVLEKIGVKQTKMPDITPQVTANNTQTAEPTIKATQTILPTESPTAEPTLTPTTTPMQTPVNSFFVNNTRVNIDESKTYPVTMSELNETTFTSASKRSDGESITKGTRFYDDGSVTFTSSTDYNSGVSFYINPVTSEDEIIDISDTRGEGFYGYDNGTKDISEYDYIRLVVTSENELNFRTYNGNKDIRTADFPASSSAETYEGGWIHTTNESIWKGISTCTAGNQAKEKYETRAMFIPINLLINKGMNPKTLTAIAVCAQASNIYVTIHSIDFVKVKEDKRSSGAI